MRFVDEFRDRDLIAALSRRIRDVSRSPITLMEVCGSHTLAVQKFGLPSLLPDTVNLISGPGCPVCVTDVRFIDRACALSERDEVIIASFGDMLRVPGSRTSLEAQRAAGRDIRIVYSTLEALKIAKENPERSVVFLGIGFETTTPTCAAAVLAAEAQGITNFSVQSAHKLMKPAMTGLIDDGVPINGYICPGHVSIVTGTQIYREITERYNVGCVVTGFEPVDVLQGVAMLVEQHERGEPQVEIAYRRLVTHEGNRKAWDTMLEVFEPCDSNWRGIGVIPESGLALRERFAAFDADRAFEVDSGPPVEPQGCLCGEVLKGLRKPNDCPLFGTACTPRKPVGACMVSSEGSCAIYHKHAGEQVA